MMTSVDRYAVFGYPVSHSKSPRIHTLFAEQTGHRAVRYSAIEVRPEQFEDAVNGFFAGGGKGLNCTVPLKELAWKIADHLSDRAQLSKAVNTLAITESNSLFGDNTDGIGLIRDLTVNHGIALADASVLILGAGGASRGIIDPILRNAPSRLVIANRTVAKAVAMAAEFNSPGLLSGGGFADLEGQSFDIIINATAASLFDELPPMPPGVLEPGGCCYDLAYSNDPTPFVRWGLAQEASRSVDGLGMLVEQAAEAFYIWRGIRPETEPVIRLLDSERRHFTGA